MIFIWYKDPKTPRTTQLGSLGDLVEYHDLWKEAFRDGLVSSSSALDMGYLWMLILKQARDGDNTLGTFQKHTHFGSQITPSATILLSRTKYHANKTPHGRQSWRQRTNTPVSLHLCTKKNRNEIGMPQGDQCFRCITQHSHKSKAFCSLVKCESFDQASESFGHYGSCGWQWTLCGCIWYIDLIPWWHLST